MYPWSHTISIVCLILLSSTMNAPAQGSPEAILDLKTAGTPLGQITRIHGSTGSGTFGVPVAGGSDCDGDGFVDFSFSSMLADPLGRTNAGEVVLVFGTGSLGGILDTAGFQNSYLKVAGSQSFELAGSEIWIDDVTGDGLGELLVCQQNHSTSNGLDGAGALTLIIGSPNLRTLANTHQYLDLQNPPTNIHTLTFTGSHAFSRLGIWVRTGDVTGDGIADLALGADESDGDFQPNQGAVYLIRGGPHLTNHTVIDLSQFGSTPLAGHIARFFPPFGSINFHLGATVQIADLDQNGRGEVLAAATLARAGADLRLANAPPHKQSGFGGVPNGRFYILWDDNFSSEPWPHGFEFLIDESPGQRTEINGGVDNTSFGEEMVGGLDFNADNKPDLFVGDLLARSSNGPNSGVGYVFYDAQQLKGKTFNIDTPPIGIRITRILGPSFGVIGSDTAAIGDFNRDGIADLMTGNPHDEPHGRNSAGSFHVLYGKIGDWPPIVNLSPFAFPPSNLIQIAEVQGANAGIAGDTGDTLCYSAASADIDGDGITDLLVNEMAGNGLATNTVDVGNLLIISGSALLGPSPTITELTRPNLQDLELHFLSRDNLTYRIQCTASLASPAWTNVLTSIPGTNGISTVNLPNAQTTSKAFYRVEQE